MDVLFCNYERKRNNAHVRNKNKTQKHVHVKQYTTGNNIQNETNLFDLTS